MQLHFIIKALKELSMSDIQNSFKSSWTGLQEQVWVECIFNNDLVQQLLYHPWSHLQLGNFSKCLYKKDMWYCDISSRVFILVMSKFRWHLFISDILQDSMSSLEHIHWICVCHNTAAKLEYCPEIWQTII